MRLLSAAVAAVLLTSPACAAVVASSLPYQNTPDWSDVVFSGTSMTVNSGVATLTTAPIRGVWFGWSPSSNTPSWSIAPNSQGNLLSLTAAFSSGADDWQAYFYDGTAGGAIYFNATPCNPGTTNCYNFNGTPGATIFFNGSSTFIPLDTTLFRTYEILVRNSDVIYRIDGQRYSGTALAAGGTTFLLVGDSSGSSPSGTGSMIISGVSFDRATSVLDLPSTVSGVPEPASWAMLLAGFGLTGAISRRRRVQVSA
ncbi:hypothetical protein CAP39_01615 [Sphingomonas sp. IBVSS1]|nr:hypothetical protein CAP39_01615 [Sphingomonas sp. IBVSS1]